MLEDFARRVRQLFQRPTVPAGDLADALPSKTDEEREWEGLLSSALGRIAATTPPPTRATEPPPAAEEPPTPVVQPRRELTLAPFTQGSRDVEDWDAAIAAARTRAVSQPLPTAPPARKPAPPPPSARARMRERVEDLEWEAAIARARALAHQAAANEERLWHKAINRARTAPTRVTIQRRPAAGDTADWTAAVAAAKHRPQPRPAR